MLAHKAEDEGILVRLLRLRMIIVTFYKISTVCTRDAGFLSVN